MKTRYFVRLRLLFVLPAVLMAPSAWAEVAYGTFVNKTTDGGLWLWNGSSAWTNAAGEAVQNPNGSGTSVVLANNTTSFAFARFPKNVSYSFDEMSGGAMQQISFYTENTSVTYPQQRLTVNDATGFKGWVANFDNKGLGELVLPSGDASFTNAINGVKLGARFGVKVPDAGMTARIGAVVGEGALYSTGSGRLIIENSPGCRGTLFATNGVVEIVGRDSADAFVPAVVPGAALHLDASAEGTVDFGETAADGYRHVTEWRDVDGGPIVLSPDPYTQNTTPTVIPWCNTPYLSAEAVSPSGLRMIDFGGILGGTVPSNCCLKMSASIPKVCEVFVVGRNRGAGGYANYIGAASGHWEWTGGQTAGLFNADASSNVRNGDIRINGQTAPWTKTWPTRDGNSLSSVFVASVAVTENSNGEGPVNMVGSDRYARFRTGSMWLGELIVYTNKLTSSQRAKINDYLMRKWLKNHEASVDFAGAYLGTPGSSAAISVPEGRVAKIDEITVADGQKLVKKGGGTLIVKTLLPSGCEIEVEGGSVKIEGAAEVSANQPASDPYVWLDASDATTVVTNRGSSLSPKLSANTYYVTRWNDCRGSGHEVYAEVPTSDMWDSLPWFYTNHPTVVSGACNGRNTIYFGVGNANASWMWLQPHGTKYAYEGFVVVRLNSWNAGRSPQYFGSSIGDIYRNPDATKTTTTRLLDAHSTPAATEALWYFDGMLMDSRAETALLTDTSQYHVISFASTVPICADLLAKYLLDKNYGGKDGDISIGEFITYDRQLTSAEHRATISYLMEKWLGRNLTETATTSATFAADTTAVVDTDTDLTVVSVTGGNGSFVKRGAGNLGLALPTNLTEYSSITVEAGSLNADLMAYRNTRLEAVFQSALFDFDASSANSFSNEIETVNGVVRTNVIAWADAEGRTYRYPGRENEPVIAYSSQIASNESLCVAIGDAIATRWKPSVEHPTFQYVEMPDGEKRPTVDFGNFGYGSTYAGAGMCFKRSFENSLPVAEIHTIFSDAHGCRRGTIVGARKDGSGMGKSFHRDQSGNGYLLASDARAEAKEGYVAVDAEIVQNPMNTVLPDGFHLVSFVPTSPLWAGNIAQSQQESCGGCRISEQIAFTSALPVDDRELLQKHLMHKWLGTPKDVAASFDVVSVAAGATASFGSGTVIESATLSGGGTITAEEVRGISALEITGELDTITLSGKATFANDAVTVTLVDSPVSLDVGEYTVFAADAISNENISFSLIGTFRPKRSVKLRKSGEQIVLSVNPVGAVLTFR